MKRTGFKRPEWKPGMSASTFKPKLDENGKPERFSSFKRPSLDRAAPYPAAMKTSSQQPETAPRRTLKRKWMRRRPTRVKAGSDPKRLAWIRTLPCCIPGCNAPAPSEPSHERKKGTGLALKEPDNRAWPTCRPHHRAYEKHEGFFDMTDEQRAAWTDEQCALLDEAYARTFGAEPELRERIAS